MSFLSIFGRAASTALRNNVSSGAVTGSCAARAFAAQREVQNPVYVVFGAAGGVGSALVKRLSGQQGAKVVSVDYQSDALDELKEHGGDVHAVDASRRKEVDKLLQQIKDQHGSLDGIANVIGQAMILKPAHITSDDEFADAINSNVKSAFNIVAGAAPLMMNNGGGSIALTSAAIAHLGAANHDIVAAAKGAVSGLALSAASTYSAHNIRVNTVSPGLLRTPMTQSVTDNEGGKDISLKVIPLGRIGEADEAAAAFEFLLHPSNSYITGNNILVDGGLGSVRPTSPSNEPAQQFQAEL